MIAVLAAAIPFLAAFLALGFALRRLDTFGAAPPDERSNHTRPTPQIGGIATLPVWILAMAGLPLAGAAVTPFAAPLFLAAAAMLFALGVADDRRSLGALPKLVVQLVACALAAGALGGVTAAFPLPAWLSWLLCTAALLTFVNLTNFIDGLDLMAVSTVGLPSAGFALMAATGAIGSAFLPAGLATAAVFLAFAIYNRPPARTFLGDGGSLPFGLVLGAMTVIVAAEAGLAAAMLLPAYILFDGCITLARRALRGENVLRAHSTHLYQRAFRSGRPVLHVVGAAALFGIAGCGLAVLAAGASLPVQAAALAVAAVLWVVLERRLPLR